MNTIIGIDISKQAFVVAILTENKPIIKEFTNNKNGFNLLIKYFTKLKIDQAKICMEKTGKYGGNLANFLYKLASPVSVVNPACIRAFAHTKLARNKLLLLMHYSSLIMLVNVILGYLLLKNQFLKESRKYIAIFKILNLN